VTARPRLPAVLRFLGGLALLAQCAGCQSTVDSLEKKGVEIKKGKMMRVYRF